MTPSVGILHASGTNRDGEASRAFALAGAAPRTVHINELRAGSSSLLDFDIVLVPGGFSYGDALGAGRRLALDLRSHLGDQLAAYVDAGRPLLGICNGFQALVGAGLLPGPALDAGGRREVTLTENELGRFECRWVHLEANGELELLAGVDELIHCPIAHGEGRIAVADPTVVDRLDQAGAIAFRYVNADGSATVGYPANPNGSAGDIAGLADPTGRIIGLMPHPEDHVEHRQRPYGVPGQLGLAMFRSVVEAVR